MIKIDVGRYNMWERIEKPWQIAFEQGWEALKNGSIPIGAVITDENGNVISLGRNRINEFGKSNPRISHAETEAIQNLDRSKYPNVREYTLFACMEPCPMCMGTFVMSNLRKLRVAARDSYCGAVHYCKDDPYIAAKNIQVSFVSGNLETVQLVLQTYYELKKQNGIMNQVTLAFEKDNPNAINTSKLYYKNGFLEDCIANGTSFSFVFNSIIEQFKILDN